MKRPSVIGLALLLAACGTTKFHETLEHPLSATASAHLPAAIAAAARAQGWTLRPLRPGQVEATRNAGERMARVEIRYDDHGYSLRYRDSTGMAFNGREIDSDYNRWVEALDAAIAGESAR